MQYKSLSWLLSVALASVPVAAGAQKLPEEAPAYGAPGAPPPYETPQAPPPYQAPYGAPAAPPPHDVSDVQGAVSMDDVTATFYDRLAPYGTWLSTDRYGLVWQPSPSIVGTGFVPYASGGQWVYTTSGWSFDSNWPFAWAVFHYGRWVELAGAGWVWVPGDTWAPSWVDWRYGDGYVGWAPLPPGARYVDAYAPYWFFVASAFFLAPNPVFYLYPRARHRALIRATRHVGRRVRGRRAFFGPPVHRVSSDVHRRIHPVRVRPPRPGRIERVPLGPGRSRRVLPPRRRAPGLRPPSRPRYEAPRRAPGRRGPGVQPVPPRRVNPPQVPPSQRRGPGARPGVLPRRVSPPPAVRPRYPVRQPPVRRPPVIVPRRIAPPRAPVRPPPSRAPRVRPLQPRVRPLQPRVRPLQPPVRAVPRRPTPPRVVPRPPTRPNVRPVVPRRGAPPMRAPRRTR